MASSTAGDAASHNKAVNDDQLDALKVWVLKAIRFDVKDNKLKGSYTVDTDAYSFVKYVAALLKQDKSLVELKELCLRNLRLFMQHDTQRFVEHLFSALEGKHFVKISHDPEFAELYAFVLTKENRLEDSAVDSDNKPSHSGTEQSSSAGGGGSSSSFLTQANPSSAAGKDSSSTSANNNDSSNIRRRSHSRSRSPRSISPDERSFSIRDRLGWHRGGGGDRRSTSPRERNNDDSSKTASTATDSTTGAASKSAAAAATASSDTNNRDGRQTINNRRQRTDGGYNNNSNNNLNYRVGGSGAGGGRRDNNNNNATIMNNNRRDNNNNNRMLQSTVSVVGDGSSSGGKINPHAVKQRCRDYDEKGFCIRGDACPFDHGSNPVIIDDKNLHDAVRFVSGTPGAAAAAGGGAATPAAPTGLLSRAGTVALSQGLKPSPMMLPAGTIIAPNVAAGTVGGVMPTVVASAPATTTPGTGITVTVGNMPGQPQSTTLPQIGGMIVIPQQQTPTAGVAQQQQPINALIQNQQQQQMAALAAAAARNNVMPVIGTLMPQNAAAGGQMPIQSMHHFNPQFAAQQQQQFMQQQQQHHQNPMRFHQQHPNNPMMMRRFVNNNNFHHQQHRGGMRPPSHYMHQNQYQQHRPTAPVNPCAIELRKVPRESNNMSKLSAHFSKFGTINNIKLHYDNDESAALVEFEKPEEAGAAYRSPEPIMQNRFIKIFWQRGDRNNRSSNSNYNNPTAAGPMSTAINSNSGATTTTAAGRVSAKNRIGIRTSAKDRLGAGANAAGGLESSSSRKRQLEDVAAGGGAEGDAEPPTSMLRIEIDNDDDSNADDDDADKNDDDNAQSRDELVVSPTAAQQERKAATVAKSKNNIATRGSTFMPRGGAPRGAMLRGRGVGGFYRGGGRGTGRGGAGAAGGMHGGAGGVFNPETGMMDSSSSSSYNQYLYVPTLEEVRQEHELKQQELALFDNAVATKEAHLEQENALFTTIILQFKDCRIKLSQPTMLEDTRVELLEMQQRTKESLDECSRRKDALQQEIDQIKKRKEWALQEMSYLTVQEEMQHEVLNYENEIEQLRQQSAAMEEEIINAGGTLATLEVSAEYQAVAEQVHEKQLAMQHLHSKLQRHLHAKNYVHRLVQDVQRTMASGRKIDGPNRFDATSAGGRGGGAVRGAGDGSRGGYRGGAGMRGGIGPRSMYRKVNTIPPAAAVGGTPAAAVPSLPRVGSQQFSQPVAVTAQEIRQMTQQLSKENAADAVDAEDEGEFADDEEAADNADAEAANDNNSVLKAQHAV